MFTVCVLCAYRGLKRTLGPWHLGGVLDFCELGSDPASFARATGALNH